MRSASTRTWTARVVLAVLLPLMLITGILAAWQSGCFNSSEDVMDNGFAADDPDNGEMRETREMKDTTDVDRGADATGANATGAGTDYVEAGEPSGESTLCPVPLPPDYHAVAYKRGVTVERWQASSAMSCRDAARELLLILQEEGFELVKAGYLDVSGEIWGCTVKTSEGASLVISLVPKSLGALRDEQNKLTLTIVRITSPEIASLAEGLS